MDDPLLKTFMEACNELWEWRYRRRLAELKGAQSNDWLGGQHMPSVIWGRIVACCDLNTDLWATNPNPWDIKKDAEDQAYERFLGEVRDEAASTTHGSVDEPSGGGEHP